MKALGIHAPWHWYIFHAGADIWNIPARSPIRGTVLVHATDSFDPGKILDATLVAGRALRRTKRLLHGQEPRPSLAVLKAAASAFVGTVDIVNCTTSRSSPWFFGAIGLVLANPVPFPKPIPASGSAGFFDVDLDAASIPSPLSSALCPGGGGTRHAGAGA